MRFSSILLATVLGGCAGANSQVATCQAEKEQLLATIRTQRDANRSLNEQVATLESRLDQAEKAIAQGGTSGPRFSKGTVEPSPVSSARSLSWRSPDAAPGGAAAARLQTLAEQHRQVKYDARSGAARIEVPLKFRDQSSLLTGEDKIQLDELTKVLKTEEASELQIVVSGSEPARAQAVVDYLDRHGIARERLLVGGVHGRAGGSSSVVLDLRAQDTAVVGLPTGERARR